MNILITVLIFSAIFLVGVVLAFLAGVYVSREGVQQVIRDAVIQDKKGQSMYCYDSDDSDYESDEDDRAVTPPPPAARIVEQYHELQDRQISQRQSECNRRCVGDDIYLKRTVYTTQHDHLF